MKNGPYTLIIAPSDYPGRLYRGRYCYEHHFVWWKAYGELPGSGYLIHHINGNKRDNRLLNLEKMTIADHTKHHSKPPETSELSCKVCNTTFTKTKRYIRAKEKAGQVDFYCSRSCMASHFGNGRAKKKLA